MYRIYYFFKVIFTIGKVFLKIFFYKSKKYLFISKLTEIFYYLRDSKLEKIECEEIIWDNKLFIDRTPIKNGNVTETESIVIGKLINKFKPERVFEIGTFNGRTTLNIAMNLPGNSKVYTLDLPVEMIKKTKFKTDINEQIYIKKNISGLLFNGKQEVKDKIIQLYGDSATFDFTNYFGSIDFVFIDGAHTYDYIINDTKIALKLLKQTGGIIIWHDYNSITFTGVTKALNYLSKNEDCLRSIKLIKGTCIAYVNTSNNC